MSITFVNLFQSLKMSEHLQTSWPGTCAQRDKKCIFIVSFDGDSVAHWSTSTTKQNTLSGEEAEQKTYFPSLSIADTDSGKFALFIISIFFQRKKEREMAL